MTQEDITACTVQPMSVSDYDIAANGFKGMAFCSIALVISLGVLSILKIFRQG